jgi:tRNA U34 5-methylaminomethyl-2-thiouridine-forming methyltransferase MnmC
MHNKIVITNDGSHSLHNTQIDEYYHSRHGAIVESEHVFIRNGFSAVKKKKIRILEIGFGTGLNALLTYQKSVQKSIKVDYHTIELYPVEKNNYVKLNFAELIGLDKDNLLKLHNCDWEKKQELSTYFKFTKNHISLEKYNTNLSFDIVYFDAFSPNKQPEMWNENIFKKLYLILKDDGFLVTYCAKGVVKRTMKDAGFKIIELDGPPGKRQMTRANKLIIGR